MSRQVDCQSCWGDDAGRVWAGRPRLAPVASIVDDSHFIVAIARCASCGQHLVSVFCETIDWADGEDPQDWLLIPVEATEVQALIAAGERDVERTLFALAPRRHLTRRFPKAADAPVLAWRSGPIRVPPHD